uniref:Uncharacterized protein n=1 Tax=Anguilla anguilla TaxID=7936 RepID=A0A0E9XW52_ANGAN
MYLFLVFSSHRFLLETAIFKVKATSYNFCHLRNQTIYNFKWSVKHLNIRKIIMLD